MIALLAGCGSSASAGWKGYFYGDATHGTGLAVSGPYATLEQCRSAMLTRVRTAPPGAGYSCGQGCPTPRDGVTADCQRTAL